MFGLCCVECVRDREFFVCGDAAAVSVIYRLVFAEAADEDVADATNISAYAAGDVVNDGTVFFVACVKDGFHGLFGAVACE